jgi:hypothetical protein
MACTRFPGDIDASFARISPARTHLQTGASRWRRSDTLHISNSRFEPGDRLVERGQSGRRGALGGGIAFDVLTALGPFGIAVNKAVSAAARAQSMAARIARRGLSPSSMSPKTAPFKLGLISGYAKVLVCETVAPYVFCGCRLALLGIGDSPCPGFSHNFPAAHDEHLLGAAEVCLQSFNRFAQCAGGVQKFARCHLGWQEHSKGPPNCRSETPRTARRGDARAACQRIRKVVMPARRMRDRVLAHA